MRCSHIGVLQLRQKEFNLWWRGMLTACGVWRLGYVCGAFSSNLCMEIITLLPETQCLTYH